MGIADYTSYLTAAKTALDIFKGIRSELPSGPRSATINQQIDKAEAALQTSEAELAKALGYTLCQCTFPPQIMLWKESEKAHVCPRSECGRRLNAPVQEPAQTQENRVRVNLENCRLCELGKLKVIKIGPHPTFGPVGLQQHIMECDNPNCRHKETRMFDPGTQQYQ